MFGFCYHTCKVEEGEFSPQADKNWLVRSNGSVICQGHLAYETKDEAFRRGLQWLSRQLGYHTDLAERWRKNLDAALKSNPELQMFRQIAHLSDSAEQELHEAA